MTDYYVDLDGEEIIVTRIVDGEIEHWVLDPNEAVDLRDELDEVVQRV